MGSSSKGNCYMVRSNRTHILVDLGISGRSVQEKLAIHDIPFWQIENVLLTHEHTDHVKNFKVFYNRSSRRQFYASAGTFEAIREKGNGMPDEDRLHVIGDGSKFVIGDIEVEAFGLSHDAREAIGYSFMRNGKKLSIVTDTGVITERIASAIHDSDLLVLESNYEKNILLYGRYPYNIKHRILGESGHLSNEDAGNCLVNFLDNLSTPKVPYVMLAHLSQENNTPQQAVLTVRNILEESGYYIGKHLKLEVLHPKEMGNLVTI